MDNSTLKRIESLTELLVSRGLVSDTESESTHGILRLFEAQYYPASAVFSELLYEELTGMLSSSAFSLEDKPNVSVVIACHSGGDDDLREAASSACSQIGVNIELILSVDNAKNRGIQATDYNNLHKYCRSGRILPRVILLERHAGVGACRNYGIQAASGQYLTALDDDDVFHPLRCLHAYLALKQLDAEWIGTGFCRYESTSRKIFIVNKKMSGCGHNSFFTKRSIFEKYGYLAPLHRHEDTEYMQRLTYYGAKMAFLGAVGHYLSTEISPEYRSLSTDGRIASEAIIGHSYIEGTYECAITLYRQRIIQLFSSLYSLNSLSDIASLFGTPCSVPELICEAITMSMRGS